MTSPFQKLTASLPSFLSSGRYSDLTIKCHGSVFKVHRIVVCTQSAPLAAAMNGEFKEAVTQIIDLEGDEPAVVMAMINFMYKEKYDAPIATAVDTSETRSATLLFHTKVYIIADKNDISALKMLAKEKYEKAAVTEWKTAEFSESISLMYSDTMESDRLLKDVAIDVAKLRKVDLIDRSDFITLLKTNAEVGYDLVRSEITKPLMTCKNCGGGINTLVTKKHTHPSRCGLTVTQIQCQNQACLEWN